jgi:hypothetical protein
MMSVAMIIYFDGMHFGRRFRRSGQLHVSRQQIVRMETT